MRATRLATTVTAAALLAGLAAACHQDPLDAAGSTTDAGAGARDAGRDADPGDAACLALPVAVSCAFVEKAYDSNGASTFARVPELASCARDIPYDGCRHLAFTFDADGCLRSSAADSPAGDIPALRQCMADGFAPERWPCLAGATVVFNESCFIH